MITYLGRESFRQKVLCCIDRYLALSPRYSLTVGIYRRGKCYVWGNSDGNVTRLQYDVGSISKTVTAHLILKLAEEQLLCLDDTADAYLELPSGDYPTVYELLTHTAGFGNLTPIEITLPALFKHGYARKNIYESCRAETVLRCLGRRKKKKRSGYGYSDFAYAILALIAERVSGRNFADLFEDFVQNDLQMKHTVIQADEQTRDPCAAQRSRVLKFWKWNRDNPYIAGGGLVGTVEDMLQYLSLQVESDVPYISKAHELCRESLSPKRNLATCIGWHTYQKSNQLWHVGGVGTFRSSVIVNKKHRIGVVVLGNAKGVASANVHYLAKMLYSELKFKRICFEEKTEKRERDRACIHEPHDHNT